MSKANSNTQLDELLTIRDILIGQYSKEVEAQFEVLQNHIKDLKTEISTLKKKQIDDKEKLSNALETKSSYLESTMAKNLDFFDLKIKQTNKGIREEFANFFIDFGKRISKSASK